MRALGGAQFDADLNRTSYGKRAIEVAHGAECVRLLQRAINAAASRADAVAAELLAEDERSSSLRPTKSTKKKRRKAKKSRESGADGDGADGDGGDGECDRGADEGGGTNEGPEQPRSGADAICEAVSSLLLAQPSVPPLAVRADAPTSHVAAAPVAETTDRPEPPSERARSVEGAAGVAASDASLGGLDPPTPPTVMHLSSEGSMAHASLPASSSSASGLADDGLAAESEGRFRERRSSSPGSVSPRELQCVICLDAQKSRVCCARCAPPHRRR